MTEYADPELIVGDWLRDTLTIKIWEDPKPPADKWITAPLAHIQRSPGGEALALSLDDVLLDVDVYAAVADHARETAQRIWSAMVFQLPRHTFSSGVTVNSSTCFMRPCWTPDPKYKRSATYRVILHGVLP